MNSQSHSMYHQYSVKMHLKNNHLRTLNMCENKSNQKIQKYFVEKIIELY
jgi:hypothetical protein